MSDKRINLEEIIENITNKSNSDFFGEDRECVKNICLEFGKKLLELAHENALIEIDMCMGQKTGDLWVDKQSILDTINQVE